MATKQPIEKEPEVQIEEALSKTESFIQKNGKLLIGIVVVAAVVVGGYFGYDQLVVAPQAEEASGKMYEAQIQFEKDSFATALNGVNGVFMGFDEIITEYSSTAQGNMAAHYAGICALNMGNFQEAINYFEQYKNVGNAAGEIIDAQNAGLIGDCQMELGNTAKAIELYKEAVSLSSSDATAPLFTQKAAIALFQEGKIAEAIELIKGIKESYPSSTQAREAEKYMTLMQQAL